MEPGGAPGRVISTPTSPNETFNMSVGQIAPQPATNKSPPPVYREIRGQADSSTVSGTGPTLLPSLTLIEGPLSVPVADSNTQNPVG